MRLRSERVMHFCRAITARIVVPEGPWILAGGVSHRTPRTKSVSLGGAAEIREGQFQRPCRGRPRLLSVFRWLTPPYRSTEVIHGQLAGPRSSRSQMAGNNFAARVKNLSDRRTNFATIPTRN